MRVAVTVAVRVRVFVCVYMSNPGIGSNTPAQRILKPTAHTHIHADRE